MSYDYDSYGKIISVVDSTANASSVAGENGTDDVQPYAQRPTEPEDTTKTLAELNPLRYRGYYYDTDNLGFYYLQSRYYDADTCRFISADEYTDTDTGYLGYNMFAYCNNNPILLKDEDGEFGILALCAIGGLISGGLKYAGEVVSNYRSGKSGAEAWTDVDWGGVASATFSGAVSAIPGGGALATAVDIVGSAAIEQGVNCLVKHETWDWGNFGGMVLENAGSALLSSKFNACDEIPRYIRDIKSEARNVGIKGTKKLTKYLAKKQIGTVVKNSFSGSAVSYISARKTGTITASAKFVRKHIV